MRAGKGPSQRQLRVAEEIRHALAQIFERAELRDPVLTERPITVTEVRVSPDLKNATAFVVPLGGGKEAETKLIEALIRASSHLRALVAQQMNLKFAPRISFRRDESFDEADKIEAILRSPDVRRDLDGDAPDGDDEDHDGTQA